MTISDTIDTPKKYNEEMDEFVSEYFPSPSKWISGRYVSTFEGGLFPFVICASYSPEIFDVTYFIYSYWPDQSDEELSPHVRLVWPVNSDEIFVYEAEECGPLSLMRTFMPNGFLERIARSSINSARDVADLLCPYMEKLSVFHPSFHDLSEAVDDYETFTPIWQKFEGRETPNFWPPTSPI
jgi:hypothetical protein